MTTKIGGNTLVSKEEFQSIIKGENENYIKDLDYLNSIGIHNFGRAIVLENIVLLGETTSFTGNLDETDNKFNPIIFLSGEYKSLTIMGGIFKTALIIKGGNFNRVMIHNGDFSDGVQIQGGNFNDDFNIIGGRFHQLIISNGTFDGSFCISDGNFDDFTIKGKAIFNKSFNIKGGEFNWKVKFLGGCFNDCFFISAGIFNKSIIVSNGTFNYDFTISGGDYLKDLIIHGGYFKDAFRIKGGEYKKITIVFSELFIRNLQFEDQFTFDSIKIEARNFQNENEEDEERKVKEFPEIQILSFKNFTLHPPSFIHVKDLRMNSLRIIGSINFSNINFTSLKYQELNNYKVLSNTFLKKSSNENDGLSQGSFDVLQPFSPKIFQIENSDLGKTQFIDCDFSEMTLDFRSSKITEVFLAGTKMPKEINENGKGTLAKYQQNLQSKRIAPLKSISYLILEQDYTQKQLGYGQLKIIYQNRGDFVTGGEYYAKEMNAYMSQLWTEPRKWGELCNLLLNRISTNHGQSWTLGLLSTGVVSIGFYTWYCSILGYTPNWNSPESWVVFKHLASNFFEFLSPIHKFDFLVGEKNAVPDGAKLIDSISRIFISYFIYQLIQAFRKHGKK